MHPLPPKLNELVAFLACAKHNSTSQELKSSRFNKEEWVDLDLCIASFRLRTLVISRRQKTWRRGKTSIYGGKNSGISPPKKWPKNSLSYVLSERINQWAMSIPGLLGRRCEQLRWWDRFWLVCAHLVCHRMPLEIGLKSDPTHLVSPVAKFFTW